MASFNQSMVLLAPLFLFLFVQCSASAKMDLLQTTCQKTEGCEKFCLRTLASNPQTALATNHATLGKAALSLALNDTIIACKDIKDLLASQNVTSQPKLKVTVQRCLYWYGIAASEFDVSAQQLGEDTSRQDEVAAHPGTQAEYCENELVSAQVKIPEIEVRNKRLSCFGRIAYAVTVAHKINV